MGHRVQVYPQLSHRRTLHTLEVARQRWPWADFTLVIGSDLVPQLPQWYQVQALLAQLKLLVIPRPNAPLDPAAIALLQAQTPVTIAPCRAQDSVSVPIWHCRCSSVFPATFPISPSSISSSAVRERGDTTALSLSVHRYIQSHRLYPRVPPCPTLPAVPPQS